MVEVRPAIPILVREGYLIKLESGGISETSLMVRVNGTLQEGTPMIVIAQTTAVHLQELASGCCR